MEKLMLLGDEAIGMGAMDAGVSGVYAYPGTPSTEILEFFINSKEAASKKIHARWCTNEKTAMEGGLGMSYAGKRALVCMKHVGLNVAADPFINSSITGANGGLVVVAADDPSMHSSQNEQDSRFFGKFAMVPMLEPHDQQEVYDMVREAFEMSEKYQVPVLFRVTTRLAHSRSGVIRRPSQDQNTLRLPSDPKQYILLPGIARRRFRILLGNQPLFEQAAVNSPFNTFTDGPDHSRGIITCGIAYNYLLECYPDRKVPYPVVKIGQYPLPRNHVEKLFDTCDSILVLEDGYPFVEEIIKGYFSCKRPVHGRLDDTVPRDGEMDPERVSRALGFTPEGTREVPPVVKPRPPKLCNGCPHIFSYKAMNEALASYSRGRVFSDIGCYTLGAFEPYNAINSCVDMGASITMAKGAADAGLVPSIAVIGDSTFTHSGMTGLLDAVIDNSPVTVIILDNATVAMTGGQPSAATGRIEHICMALGVEKEHVVIINPIPKDHEENVKIFKREIEYPGVSVIIPRRECIQTAGRRIRERKKQS